MLAWIRRALAQRVDSVARHAASGLEAPVRTHAAATRAVAGTDELYPPANAESRPSTANVDTEQDRLGFVRRLETSRAGVGEGAQRFTMRIREIAYEPVPNSHCRDIAVDYEVLYDGHSAGGLRIAAFETPSGRAMAELRHVHLDRFRRHGFARTLLARLSDASAGSGINEARMFMMGEGCEVWPRLGADWAREPWAVRRNQSNVLRRVNALLDSGELSRTEEVSLREMAHRLQGPI